MRTRTRAKGKPNHPRSRSRQVVFACQVIRQPKHLLVMFGARASVLWNILSINRKIEDKDEGYQRALSPSRIRRIRHYIEEKNALPTSILVSFDNAKLSDDERQLLVPKSKDAGWVIDGQHRLAGAHQAGIEIHLPVVAFLGLDVEDQIFQFITINREAKGVPTSLYYDLLKHLPPTKTPAEVAKERSADIAAVLKRDEQSPFFARFVATRPPKRGELSLTNFVRKINPYLVDGKGFLSMYTEFEQISILNNYYSALSNVFPREFGKHNSIFYRTLGFGAMMNALPHFFHVCLAQHKSFRIGDATNVFKEISHFDFGSWDKYGTGSAAEVQAGEDVIAELRQAFEARDEEYKTLITE